MNTAIISASYARRETHERFVKPQTHIQMFSILLSMASAKFVVTIKNHSNLINKMIRCCKLKAIPLAKQILIQCYRKFYDHASIYQTSLFRSHLNANIRLVQERLCAAIDTLQGNKLNGKHSRLIMNNYTKRELWVVLSKVQRQQYETYKQFGLVDREINDIDFQQRSCR